MGPETPEWATWGNGGFDPRYERVDRKGRKKIMPGEAVVEDGKVENSKEDVDVE